MTSDAGGLPHRLTRISTFGLLNIPVAAALNAGSNRGGVRVPHNDAVRRRPKEAGRAAFGIVGRGKAGLGLLAVSGRCSAAAGSSFASGAGKSMFLDASPDLRRQRRQFVIGKVDCRHGPASFMPSLSVLTARAHWRLGLRIERRRVP